MKDQVKDLDQMQEIMIHVPVNRQIHHMILTHCSMMIHSDTVKTVMR